MVFLPICPNCNNIFDITKAAQQMGGSKDTTDSELATSSMSMSGGEIDYGELIKKIINNEEVNTELILKISMDELTKSINYKKLKPKQKELVYNKIQDMLPVDKKKLSSEEQQESQEIAYFRCYNCGLMKKIEDGTRLFSRVSSDIAQGYATSDISDMIHSDIIPRTRKYICPNKKCASHTDLSKREAVFFRMNNKFDIKYICTACETSF